MTQLSYERYCDEIVRQTGLLTDTAADLDLTAAVPSCPGWTVARLLHHVGRVQRWAGATVGSRATGPLPVEASGGPPAGGADPAALGAWLAEGAAALAGALREAGPGTPVWTPAPGGTTDFYARRLTHETAVHRADTALAAGAGYELDPEVALDAIDEWLELGALPAPYQMGPQLAGLLGPARTLHLHATDTPAETAAEWLIDLTGQRAEWRRAHQKAAVAVRAPLTDLLLIIYRRRPAHGDGTEIFGDTALLDLFLAQVSFG